MIPAIPADLPATAPAATAKAYVAPPRPLFAFILEASTPRKLQWSLAAITVLTGVFWVSVSSKIAQSTRTLELIGKETAPSIIAASGIGAKLASAHRHAAAALLSSGGDATICWQKYDADLEAASERLVGAAQNISSTNDSREAVIHIVQKLPEYAALIGQSRQLKGAEREILVEQADHVLHAEILPATEKLDLTQFQRLNAVYMECHRNAVEDAWTSLALGTFVLAALLKTQIFLYRHFRRLLNLPLVLASALLLIGMLYISSALTTVHEHLRVAKADAFDSVYVLWKARSVAQDAHADRAFYLLTQNRRDFENAFSAKMNKLANAGLTETMITNIEQHANSAVGGLLGSEAGNITFSGERQSIVDTLRGFLQYTTVDSKIRALELDGQHADAVSLCLQDTSFFAFDRGMETTLKINEREFNSAIDQGFANLSWLPWLAGATGISIVALSWLGLRPRMNEYWN